MGRRTRGRYRRQFLTNRTRMNISRDLQVRLETDWAVLGDSFVSGGLNTVSENRVRGHQSMFGNRGQVRTCEPLQGLALGCIECPHHRRAVGSGHMHDRNSCGANSLDVTGAGVSGTATVSMSSSGVLPRR